jgi:hypothetical protein
MSGQEFGQGEGIALVGFDRGGGDQLDVVGVSHDHFGHFGGQQIIG